MNCLPLPPGAETRLLIVDSEALTSVPAVLTEYFPGCRPWLVADDNTFAAAGSRLLAELKSSGAAPVEPVIFPAVPTLHADSAIADRLAAEMPENAVPVAVGSGTINDLVKRASGIRGRAYCCVPTACSVDGYTSRGASLSCNNFKQTMPCPAPLAVVADTEVLKSAPSPMLAAGYADLAAKLPAGGDWIIADQLGIEAIAPEIWALVQGELRDRLADHTRLDKIFQGLAATGFAMQLYRESRPASGADHLFSHIWEMENLHFNGEVVSHGFKVSIGTLMSTALMEFVIDTGVDTARARAVPGVSREEREREVQALLVRGCYGEGAHRVAMEKFLSGRELTERREAIFSAWETLRSRLRKQLIPFAELRRMLADAGCPVRPAEIGLDKAQFLHGYRAAQLIRKRYTILDLLYEAGLFETAEQRLAAAFEI